MRGFDRLLALRMSGRMPTMACITVAKRCWVTDHWHEEEGIFPHLLVEPRDRISRLDLRCVFRLLVDVSGHEEDAQRVREVFAACVKAGAERVIGAIHRRNGGGLEAVEYMDTAGVLTWLE